MTYFDVSLQVDWFLIHLWSKYTMRHHQKISIARLISDLIKSDDVICKEEIALYNQIVRTFDISQDELYEAQSISQAEAVSYIRHMMPNDQKKIFSILIRR